MDPKTLKKQRIQIHVAAQLVSAVGFSLIPEREDDSHTAMTWNGEKFLGEEFDGKRVTLEPENLTIAINDKELPLAGKTYSEAISWLNSELNTELKDNTSRYGKDFPETKLLEEGTFTDEGKEERKELAKDFTITKEVLEEISPELEITVWPHHFDIAILEELENGNTIGLGMSPGDEKYHEPYWYVGPSPRTEELAVVGEWDDSYKIPVLPAKENTTKEDVKEFFTENREIFRDYFKKASTQ